MIKIESFTDRQNERQARIERLKLLGVSQRGLERVVSTARARNKAREDERMDVTSEAAASAQRKQVDSRI